MADTWSPALPPSSPQAAHSAKPPWPQSQTKDPNLQFTDELEAYHTSKVKANFTPAPVSMVTSKPLCSQQSKGSPQLLQDAVSQLLELLEQ